MPQLRPRSVRRRSQFTQPIEMLEDRRLLAVFTVTSAADAGAGTLRDAIAAANGAAGADLIAFNLPSGNTVISPTTALPEITGQLTIDGTTQPGYAGNPIVQLNGQNIFAAVTGLVAGGSSVTIKGLSITSWAGGAAVELKGTGSHLLQGNHIGTDPGGMTKDAGLMNNEGILVSAGTNSVVESNLISGNASWGVRVTGAATNTIIQNNTIGLDLTGAGPLGNEADGVRIEDTSGVVKVLSNTISANAGNGVRILNSSGNIVQGNRIGTDAAGTAIVDGTLNDLGNHGDGIRITGASAGNLIGGAIAAQRNVIGGNFGEGIYLDTTGAGNTITNNAIGVSLSGANDLGNFGNGIGVNGGTGNSLRGNSIDNNAGYGIDLGWDGVTLNDSAGHVGPNNFQNFPVIATASRTGATGTAVGTLNSTTNADYWIDLYASPAGDVDGYGEGRFYVGSVLAHTDAAGLASFTAALSGVPAGPLVLSGTATDAAGNTSEFSAFITVANAAPVPGSIAGFVYEDLNSDGIKQPGEPGIGGVSVKLTGAASQTLLTNPDGSYLFNNLAPGNYTVTQTQPGGYLDGKDTPGAGALPNGNDSFTAALAAGQNITGNNFGEVRPGSLSGFVFKDNNNDGIKQAAEPGIGAVTITLSGVNDLGQAVFVQVKTAWNGAYSFKNLRPGTYSIQETQPLSKYSDGLDQLGSLGGIKSNDLFSSIFLQSNANGFDYNFGERPYPGC